jgi:hypothetical protein
MSNFFPRLWTDPDMCFVPCALNRCKLRLTVVGPNFMVIGAWVQRFKWNKLVPKGIWPVHYLKKGYMAFLEESFE